MVLRSRGWFDGGQWHPTSSPNHISHATAGDGWRHEGHTPRGSSRFARQLRIEMANHRRGVAEQSVPLKFLSDV